MTEIRSKAIRLQDIPWYSEEGFEKLYSKDILTAEENSKMSVHYTKIEPGAKAIEEHHLCSEIHFILSGSGKFHMENKIYQIEKDLSVFVNENVLHKIENTSNENLVMLAVCCPPFTETIF